MRRKCWLREDCDSSWPWAGYAAEAVLRRALAPGAVQCRRTWVGVVSMMRVPGGGGELTGKLIYFPRVESEKVAGAVCEG